MYPKRQSPILGHEIRAISKTDDKLQIKHVRQDKQGRAEAESSAFCSVRVAGVRFSVSLVNPISATFLKAFKGIA